MAVRFDEFDKAMGADFNDKVKEAAANSYEEVPKGTYEAKLEKLELGMTKDGKRPMFKVQLRLVSGVGAKEMDFMKKFTKKKPCIFMNRVVFGTKNDANMIGSVVAWLNKLVADEEHPVVFTSYSDLAEEILDIAEDFAEARLEVDYDPNSFNSISIKNVF